MSTAAVPPGAEPVAPDPEPLVEVRDLSVVLTRSGRPPGRRTRDATLAVDRVSFAVAAGETLGIVGESGSGKTTTARAVLRLAPATGGSIRFRGQDITQLGERAMRPVRRHMQMVFQDPYGSLNPHMTVGEAVAEPLVVHGVSDPAGRRDRVRELLEVVGLPPSSAAAHPGRFSGGQRQRINIARALALGPSLVVADEPTSALDVSIQAQIANLLLDIQREFALTLVFISHDLSLVRLLSTRVAVMYQGRIIETAPVDELFDGPAHPYSQLLFSSIRIPDPEAEQWRRRAVRTVAVPAVPTTGGPAGGGCRFAPRCPDVQPVCREQEPELRPLAGRQWAACHFAEEVREDGVALRVPPVAAAGPVVP